MAARKRRCLCGCGEPVSGAAKFASRACRGRWWDRKLKEDPAYRQECNRRSRAGARGLKPEDIPTEDDE